MILSRSILDLIALGLCAGIFGGMFGIGGGLIMVPALILLFGYLPKSANGTSLMAQLLPVNLLGVLAYWRRGEADIVGGLWIALGLFLGTFLGAYLTGLIPPLAMRRLYGAFLLSVGIYFLFWNPARFQPRPRPDATPPPAVSAEGDQAH